MCYNNCYGKPNDLIITNKNNTTSEKVDNKLIHLGKLFMHINCSTGTYTVNNYGNPHTIELAMAARPIRRWVYDYHTLNL